MSLVFFTPFYIRFFCCFLRNAAKFSPCRSVYFWWFLMVLLNITFHLPAIHETFY